MPLRKLLSSSQLSAEDIELLESAFNQSVPPSASDDERHDLARDLVGLFTSGIRSETELIRRLAAQVSSVKREP